MKSPRVGAVGVIVMIAATISFPCAAQQASFKGTWKLNLEKSFLAGDHPARDYELTKIIEEKGSAVEQTDVALHVSMMNIPLPDSKTTMELVPDGKEREVQGPVVFPGAPPAMLKVVATWQGNTLSVNEWSNGFLGQMKTHRRYFVSEDGLQLTELIEGHSAYGDTEQRRVFDRQPGS